MKTTQVRLYEIAEGRLADFVDAWRAGVVPLRRRFGFEIEAAWTIPDESRFCWVVSYEGPLSWKEAEEAYYGSPERAALDPDPAQWISRPQAWLAEPVDV
jgi:hypothetical protein